jgi:hypothetical protein
MCLLNIKSKVVPVLKHHAIKTYGRMHVELHISVTSALDVGECPPSQLGHFTLLYIEEAANEPQGSFGHTGKLKYP